MSRVAGVMREAAPAATKRPLGALSILRESSKLSGANLLSALLAFPTNLLVARTLGPELLGVVGMVTMWQFYAGLSRPGIFSAAYREMPVLLARHDDEEAARVQNVGITAEGLYLLLPTIALVVIALFSPMPEVRNAMLVGAPAFLITTMVSYAILSQFAHQRFSMIAKAKAVAAVTSTLCVAATVWPLSFYAPIIAPAVGAVAIAICLRLWAPSMAFRIQLDRREAWRLLKVGFPLSLGTLAYWGLRSVDRTAAAAWLSLTELGYFTFAMLFVTFAIMLVSDFGNVVQPRLWAELGRSADPRALGPHVRNLSLMIMAVTCAGVNLAQAGFALLVHWFVPQFTPSVAAFDILAFALAGGTAGILPAHILGSATVNRQNLATVIWGLGIAIGGALAYLAVQGGHGLTGVVTSTVLAQTIVSALLLWAARYYLFAEPRGRLAFCGSMFGLLSLAAVLFGLFTWGPFAYSSEHFVRAAVLRTLLTVTAWGGLAALVHLRRKAKAAAASAATTVSRTGSSY